MTNVMDRLPYPGLRAFNKDESDLFFGRDDAIDEMVDKLATTRFLAVLGASGSGKSSLVRTGLLDALDLGLHPQGSDWIVCDFAPGGSPYTSLGYALLAMEATATSAELEERLLVLESMLRQGPHALENWLLERKTDTDTNLLLLVDQFEELFRFNNYSEREDAEGFVNLLVVSAASTLASIHVVITMRSEYIGACALLPGLSEAVNDGAFLTPRMMREECELAIVGPARIMGASIEPALVSRMLNDLATMAPWESDQNGGRLQMLARRADQLPLMQHVLNRLWQRAVLDATDQPPELRLKDYLSAGGLTGALEAHGKEIITSLETGIEPLVEPVFRSLTDGISIESATRRPQRFIDLVTLCQGNRNSVTAIVERFRANDCNFLRPGPDVPLTDETVVDISHESLIRQWPRLSGYVTNESRAGQFWRRLSAAREAYDSASGDLLSGLELANLREWWTTENPTSEWAERYGNRYDQVDTFLRLSIDAQEASQQQIQIRDAHRKRRLKVTLGVVSAFALLSAGTAVWGLRQQRAAEGNLELAVSAADNFAVRFSEKLRDDLTIPIASKLALLEDTEARFNTVSGSTHNDDGIDFQRAALMINAAEALLNAGWAEQASERLELANQILAEGGKTDTLPKQRSLSVRLMLAKAALAQQLGDHMSAHELLARARGELDMLPIDSWSAVLAHIDTYVIESRLRYVEGNVDEYAVASQEIIKFYNEQLPLMADPVSSAEQQSKAKVEQQALLSRMALVKNGRDTGRWQTTEPQAELDAIKNDIDSFAAQTLLADLPPRVKYLNAYHQNAAAWLLRETNMEDQADELAFSAVRSTAELITQDPGNETYQLMLAYSLLSRSLDRLKALQLGPAKADLTTARAISHAVKRTDSNYLEATILEVWLDTYFARLAIAKQEDPAVFINTARARVEFLQSEPATPPVALIKLTNAYLWTALDKEREIDEDEARRPINTAIEMINSLNDEIAAGRNVFAALRERNFLFLRLLQLPAEKLEDEIFFDLVEQSLADRPIFSEISMDSQIDRENRSYFSGLAAIRSGAAGKHEQKLSYLQGSITLALASLAETKNPAQLLKNILFYLRDAIDASAETGNATDLARFVDEVASHDGLPAALRATPEDLRQVSNIARVALEKIDGDISSSSDDPQLFADTRTRMLDLLARIDQSSIDQSQPDESQESGGVPTPSFEVVSPELRVLKLADMPSATQDGEEDTSKRINWSVTPLFEGAWRTVQGDELLPLLEEIRSSELLNGKPVNEIYFVRTLDLDFYANGQLIEFESPSSDGVILYTLLKVNGTHYLLDGTSPPIHAANKVGPLQIETAQQVASYLRFFMTYISSDEGVFRLVESRNDVEWHPTATQKEKQDAERMMRPVVIWKESSKDGWKAVGTVQYGTTLFHAELLVPETGVVEMLQDIPVFSGLSINPLSFENGGRGNLEIAEQLGSVDLENTGLKPINTQREALLDVIDQLSVDGIKDDLTRHQRESIFMLEDTQLVFDILDEPNDAVQIADKLVAAELRPDLAVDLLGLTLANFQDNESVKASLARARAANSVR